MSSRQPALANRDHIITFFILLIICIGSFLPFKSLTSPPITSDDWSLIVAPYAFDELKPINLANHRPIDLTFYYVLTSIFGLRFEYYYLLNVLVIFLSAVMVYALIKRTLTQYVWFASLATIVYLIYPVDYTRTWIMMLYIRFWWLVSLAAIWFLLDFVESGNKWKLALALLGVIVPLGAYEGQFGVIVMATLLIAIASKNKPLSRRLVLIGSILIIGILFYIWRFHIQANITEIRYYSAGAFEFNPLILISRYFQGFDIFFCRWLEPVKTQLGFSFFQILAGMVIYLALCILGTYLVFNTNTSQNKLQFKQKLPVLKEYFLFLLIGGAFWIAGYFPIIGLYSPSLNGHASRVNSFAIAGAALALIALAVILAVLLARSDLHFRPLAIALLMPFILAGIFVQGQMNIENRQIWETQRNIWHETFETIPNILDEKSLVIILPTGNQSDTLEAIPFTTAWEIDAGVKVLYNNPDIRGYFYYKDLPDPQFEFTKNGIIPQGTDRLIGYKRLIFVLYHPMENNVELVENLEGTLSLPFSVNNYSPHENIIPAEPTTTEFRWLVK